ncbi:MAG TPA: hypothetical protein VFN55_18245 [Solirubrobacteraceae bacterium]|nr:hypothetical protein [Solirubrobacteraceae bacterium]
MTVPHRIRALLTLLVAAAVVIVATGSALGRVGAHGAQKRAIMNAAGLRPATPLGCYDVDISTANRAWAATHYAGSEHNPCLRYAADGVSITHYARGRWHFVTAGSAFSCPIPGHIPAAVQHDLRLFCHRG